MTPTIRQLRRPASKIGGNLLISLPFEPRRVVFWGQSFRFTAAQLAQEILLRFKRSAGELPLVAMVALLVLTKMAAIAIYDPRVRRAQTAEP